jgi:mannitol/fructose-specific phosphotransferase system IIA component (Ntr-type)
MSETGTLSIHQLLSPRAVRVGLPGTEKDEVIETVLGLLEGDPAVDDLDQVREDVFERERVMSTGVGKGLALPHARSSAVRDTVAAFAVTASPVEFGAIDSKAVRLVFLMVGPEWERSRHIKLLSRISRLMSRDEFRERLLSAPDPESVIELFREAEEELT